jgi:hypothetical protein
VFGDVRKPLTSSLKRPLLNSFRSESALISATSAVLIWQFLFKWFRSPCWFWRSHELQYLPYLPSTCCGNRLPGVGGWCIYVARDSRDDRCGDIGVESIRNSGGLQRTDGMLQDYLHWVSFRYLEYLDLLKRNRAVGSCAMVLAEVYTFLKGRVKKNLNRSIVFYNLYISVCTLSGKSKLGRQGSLPINLDYMFR